MSTISWKGAVNGLFSDAADWSTGAVPGVSDYAHINVTGAAFTVTANASTTVRDIQTSADGTLDITTGTFTASYGTSYKSADVGANNGAIDIQSGATFKFGGQVTTYGAISIASGGVITDLASGDSVLAAKNDDFAVTNDGQLISESGGNLVIQDCGVIGTGVVTIQAGATITLAGGILDGSGMTIAAGGVLDVTTPGIDFPGININLVTNAGTIEANQGIFGVGVGTVNNAGGTILIAKDATIELNGALVEGGLISIAAGALLTGANASYIDLAGGGSVINAGTIANFAGGDLAIMNGTVSNADGKIIVGATTSAEISLRSATIAGGAISISASGRLIAAYSGVSTLLHETGSSIVNNGVIGAGAAGELIISGGTTTGSGEFYAGYYSSVAFKAVTVNGYGASELLATVGTGAINIENASVVEVQGQIVNAGNISLASTTKVTQLKVLAAGVTLSGGGDVDLSGSFARIVGATASAVLTNADDTLVGSGELGFGSLTLINQAKGVIEATGLLTVDTNGSTLTNAGLMEAITGGTLLLSATTINQSGGGTIEAAGGTVDLTTVDVIGGTLATTGKGLLRVNAAGDNLDGTKSTVSLTGELQVLGGRALTVTGTLADSGKVNVYGGKLIIGVGGATFSGKGGINLNTNSVNAITSTATVTLTNDVHINGSGTLGSGTMTLVNQTGGLITNSLTFAMVIDTGANTIVNAGTIDAVSGEGGISVVSAVDNTGKLLAFNKSTLTLQGTVTGGGIAAINGGKLVVAQAFAEDVDFLGTTGVLELEDSVAYTGKVSGLSKTGTNSLDLTDIAFTKGKTTATYSGTATSGTLTVTDGIHTAHIKLTGSYSSSGFVTSSNGHGGTTVVDPTAAPAATAPLAQAMAGFQVKAAPNVASRDDWRAPPRTLHAQV